MLRNLLEQHNVATTALLTNFWKDQAKAKNNWPTLTIHQGSREKDLFKDEGLKLFYDEMTKMEAENRLDKRMWLPLATRTRYFRKTLSHAIKNQNIQQIIILGSGFDTLPVRKSKFSHTHGVRFFEIDKPEILNCKQDIYNNLGINQNAIHIGLNYTEENFIESLKPHIDFQMPTLILWEGNTLYLTKQEVIKTIRTLTENFDKLILCFDFLENDMQKEKNTLETFASRQSPFKSFFSFEEITNQCIEMGLNCQNRVTGSDLAKFYEVDETPYHTAEPYSLVSFVKNIEPSFQLKK